jgi:hypothetical protein
MDQARPRRRALCVRPLANPNASPLVRVIYDEWIHALSLHCDVTVIEQDFDFAEVYEQVRPDFVIFDAVQPARPVAVKIANAKAYPHVPRALFINCDPHDAMRPYTFQILDDYAIDTVFCGIEHLQQMPELAQLHCFVIPLFIDEDIFRDYGLEKTIPVAIFGGHMAPNFYPWRHRITEEIQHHLPTLVYPHPGYYLGQSNVFEARNEKYARLLSASYYSVADTTRLDYVVRKHLEIPAAGAVLVAPDSEVVKALGFVDMQNCLLGEGEDLYRRMADVAADPSLYEAIRTAGRDLIHGRYTRAHWTYLVDWFETRALCEGHEVTQQMGRFGRFRNVAADAGVSSIDGLSFGPTPLSAILNSASAAILLGQDLAAARRDLFTVRQWVDHLAEPNFLLGVIAILDGDLDQAIALIARRAPKEDGEFGKDHHAIGLLDPCELALLLLIAAVRGNQALYSALIGQASLVPHVVLRRTNWLLSGAPADVAFGDPALLSAQPGDCPSIHWLGQESYPDWLLLSARLLDANGWQAIANQLRAIAAAFDGDPALSHAA